MPIRRGYSRCAICVLNRLVAEFGIKLIPCWVETLPQRVHGSSSPTIHWQAIFSGVTLDVLLPVLTDPIPSISLKSDSSTGFASVISAATLFRIGSVSWCIFGEKSSWWECDCILLMTRAMFRSPLVTCDQNWMIKQPIISILLHLPSLMHPTSSV